MKGNPIQPQRQSDSAASNVRHSRLFWAVVIGIPILFFVCIEVVLRTINYGEPFELVIRTRVEGKEFYTLNRSVARRYFTQTGVAIPEAFDDLFEIEKGPHTKRIFMLGESTMAGYPFDYNATAPRLLLDRLRQQLPEYKIEVINVGLAAVNSYTVLDLIKELADYQPDAFVLYLGHNEFYGAFGVGSTQYLGRSRTLVNLYLRLQHLRTFLLLRNVMAGISGLIQQRVTPKDATLMEIMVRDNIIRYKSEEYERAKDNFAANLADIIGVASSHNVPIAVSTLTSNIRNQRPLLPAFRPDLPHEDTQRWNDLVHEGTDELIRLRFARALGLFERAIEIDSTNADAHFLAGVCFDSLHQYEQAYQSYSRARDYDALRFRATEEFSELIRRTCDRLKVPLVDAERAFEVASPHRLVGNSLMLEHLHPNFDGYFLLAKAFSQTLRGHDIPIKAGLWSPELPDEEYRQKSGVTNLTLESANIRIHELTGRWPFKPAGSEAPAFTPSTPEQEVAFEYVSKRIGWSSAHLRMAEVYRNRKEFAKAYAEYYALSKVAWYSYQPFMNMGDMERVLEHLFAAESLYHKALELDANPFVHIRLGMLYYDMDSLRRSIDQFESAFQSEETSKEMFTPKDRSLARYFLGVAYGKSGNLRRAKANLQLALDIDSSNSEARALLSQLR